MSGARWIHVIDAGDGARAAVDPPEAGLKVPLVPEDGEYAVALSRLVGSGILGADNDAVSAEVFLHLYAYELAERMRERAAGGGEGCELLIMPFWPEALFEAAGLAASGVREIEALFSGADKTYYVRQPKEVMEREARRVLGRVRFDHEEYLAVMDRMTRDRGWERMEA
jgi:hypothetical protein